MIQADRCESTIGSRTSSDLDDQFVKTIETSNRNDPPLEQLRHLLTLGAHVDGPSRYGLPIRLALVKYSETLVNFLIDEGADVNAKRSNDKLFRSILHWAVYRVRGYGYDSHQYRFQASFGNIISLIAAGADPTALDRNGDPASTWFKSDVPPTLKNVCLFPLHAAVKMDRPELCLKLMEAGYDPEQKIPGKQTALSFAKSRSHVCLGVMQSWLATKAINEVLKQAVTPSPQAFKA